MMASTSWDLHHEGVIYARVVHEQHYRPVVEPLLRAHALQQVVDEVLKDTAVNTTLDELSRHNFLLSDGRQQAVRVLLLNSIPGLAHSLFDHQPVLAKHLALPCRYELTQVHMHGIPVRTAHWAHGCGPTMVHLLVHWPRVVGHFL